MSKRDREVSRQPLDDDRKTYAKLKRRLHGVLGVMMNGADDAESAQCMCDPFIPGSQYYVERLAKEQLLLVLMKLIRNAPPGVMDEINANAEHILCDAGFRVPAGAESAAEAIRSRARANLARLNAR